MIKDLIPGDSITIRDDDFHELINFKVNAYGDFSLRERGDELYLCICIKPDSLSFYEHDYRHENK